MFFRSPPRLVWLLGFVLPVGCCYPVSDHADLFVHGMANRTIDLQPMPPADVYVPPPPLPPDLKKQPLTIPPGFPGENARPIQMPKRTDPSFRQKMQEFVEQYYPPLPAIGMDPQAQPGPNGVPLALADLQRLAMSNSPLIRQAAADVEAARGTMIQAGAYPNPTFGYEGDTSGTAGLPTYWGAFVDQVIKTAGKLKLAQAAAHMDYFNAQLALRRAQTDVMAQVRGGYFAVLVALENIRINKLLVKFTDQVYAIQIDVVKEVAAPYEPMQLRVLAYQARVALLQARNNYTTAWKQLAANMGVPGMAPTEVAGRADMPIPVFHHDQVLARVLNQHTDVGTAQNAVLKARYNLRLAQVTPVGDVELRAVAQKDFTTPPFLTVWSLQVSTPLPVWDRNKGGIIQAQGQLLRATEQAHQVRDNLTFTLADAFNRYDTTRRTLANLVQQLRDQVRVYRGVYDRRHEAPQDVGFGDIVTAQQTLANILASYLTTLGAQWQAVVDVANLMQTDDLFQLNGETQDLSCPGLWDLEHLKPLRCCHRSSPLSDPQMKGADGSWPEPIYAPKKDDPLPLPTVTEGLPEQARRTTPARKPPVVQLGGVVPVNATQVLTREEEQGPPLVPSGPR